MNSNIELKRLSSRPLMSCLVIIAVLAATGLGAQAAPWSFGVICDCRGDGPHATPSHPAVNTPVVNAIARSMTNDGVQLVIAPGDLIHGQVHVGEAEVSPQLAIWTNAMAPVYQAGIPVYPVRGNHENYVTSGVASHVAWSNAFAAALPNNGPHGEASMTYSFSFSNAFFVGLDQYHGAHDDSTYHALDQAWLNAQLASNTLPHVFAFGHEPAFRVGINCLSENPTNRNTFWNSLANAGGRMYITGHSHVYGRALASVSNGLSFRHIIIGTSGGPLDSWDGHYDEGGVTGATLQVNGVLLRGEAAHAATNIYGYLLVTVDGDRVTTRYKATTNYADPNPTWAVADTWTYDQVSIQAPQNIAATEGAYTDRVVVSWTAAANALSYEVWRNTVNTLATVSLLATNVTVATYSDTSAMAQTTYHYWVRACYAAGASPLTGGAAGWIGDSTNIGPDIRVNGARRQVTEQTGEVISTTVQIDPGPYAGIPADWWVLANTPWGWYNLNSDLQFIPVIDFNTIQPAYQGGLSTLFPPLQVLRTSALPAGAYTLYFGVDPLDGHLNLDQVWYDAVVLTIE